MESNKVISTDAKEIDIAKKEGVLGKTKAFFGKIKGKKGIEIIVAVVLIGIILIIYFSTLGNTNKTNAASDGQASYSSSTDYCKDLENKLNATLAGIKGAGKTSAIINFESSAEIIIAYVENITKNGSTENGSYVENSQTNKTPQILNDSGNQIPLILKEIYPKVKGVLVSAQGADDPKVKLEIINSVSVLLAISPNLVYVTIMQK